MSLLTGKYGVYIFTLIGAALVIVFLKAGIKLFKKAKKAKSKADKLKKLVDKHKPSSIGDSAPNIINEIAKVGKKHLLPSFLYFYDGNTKEMLDYIKRLSGSDECHIIALNDSFFVILSTKKVIFASTLSNVDNIDIKELNKLFNKVYKKGYIRDPLLLMCFTDRPKPSGFYVSFMKIITKIHLYQKFEMEFQLSVDLHQDDDSIRVFYDIIKQNMVFSFEAGEEEQVILSKINAVVDNLRGLISQHIVSLTKLDITTLGMLKVAAKMESIFLSLIPFIKEIDTIRDKVNIDKVIMNLGIHPGNIYYQIFDFESKIYRKKIKFYHIAFGFFMFSSIVVSLGFIHDIYFLNNLNAKVNKEEPFYTVKDGEVKLAEKQYQDWIDLYRDQLFFYPLYKDKGVIALNRVYGQLILDKFVIPTLNNRNNLVDEALYLSLAVAEKTSPVVDIFKKQHELISIVTGLDENQLDLMYQFGVYNNSKSFSTIDYNSKSQMLTYTSKLSHDLFSDNVVNLTNEELRRLIWNKVVWERKICLLNAVLPAIEHSLLLNKDKLYFKKAADYLIDVQRQLPDDSHCGDEIFLKLMKIIPRYNDVDSNSFGKLTSLIVDYNSVVEQFFDTNYSVVDNTQELKRILIQSEYNSIMEHVFSKKGDDLSLLSLDNYYGYSLKTDFSRSIIKVSLAYTKSVILNHIKNILKEYDKVKQIFGSYNINFDVLQRMIQDKLLQYANHYIEAMNYLLNNSVPSNISEDNLNMFLLDLSSDNTPFDNIIKYVSKNTTFSDDEKLPASLQLIKDKFLGFNTFIQSKEYQDYKSVLLNVRRTIMSGSIEDYLSTYKQLVNKGEGSLIGQISDLITPLGNSDPNIYHLFQFPLDEVKLMLSKKLIDNLQLQWARDIVPNISRVNSLFPFDFKSEKSIDPDELNNMFGPQGSVYNEMLTLLEPFSFFNQATNNWKVSRELTPQQQKKIAPYLIVLNDFYHLQTVFWDKDGNPNTIKIKVKPQTFKDVSLDGKQKMVLSFMYLGTTEKALGLNAESDSFTMLNYNWQLQPAASVGWLNDDDESFQQSYTGNWSFFKMLANANCNKQWVCTWKIKSNNAKLPPYSVSYQIKSDALVNFKAHHKGE
ncbi:hypothetical protein [uncultured Shewanella sp.]|uniref:hypothetical protein n=1 Tax=uncultured Shewanella sp. TaxID=173975 RepID=UPI00261B1DCB|nr:hypothetical protein [uncultured Shewanella sp.]